MNKNVGTVDRILRAILALIFAAMIVMHSVDGVLAWILGIVAAVLLITSAVSFCPLYAVLRISTHRDQSINR